MPRPPPPAVPDPAPGQTSRPVQMADIANLAGVSVSTVSRALAGHPRINLQTRERIAELARSLQYSMHLGAQNLRLGQQPRPHTVAVLLDAAAQQPLRDPLLLALIGSLADALGTQGLQLQLCRADAEPGTSLAELAQGGHALGLVLLGEGQPPAPPEAPPEALVMPPLPRAAWGQPQAGRATVGFDERAAGQLATAHLLAGGARRVLFLGLGDQPETRLRLQGYLDAHRQAGLAPDPALTHSLPLAGDAAGPAVRALLARNLDVDAVFASDDLLAISLLGALQAGLQRPGAAGLAVVGCGDTTAAQYAWPSLSSVRLPIASAGPALLRSLQSQRAGQAISATLLPPELIVRDSSRRP